MGKLEKLREKILSGKADAGIHFSELLRLLARFGFSERVRGDHHIFARDGVEEILNIQPRGSMAKPYQVKQVRQLVLRYRLEIERDE